eukprot:m51a1_g5930 putative mannosyl-oligosaccharide alpha- - (668) ;mRNA; r:83895-86784
MAVRGVLHVAVVVLALSTLRASAGPVDVSALRERTRRMFFHAWDAYLAHAFPADELQPIECKGRTERTRGYMDDILGRFSLTMVDGLDTLAVMEEWSEFESGLRIVARNVSFSEPVVVSVFETTIRVLGGLLSCHMLAEEHADKLREPYAGELLQHAVQLADRLLPAFATPTGIPCARVHLTTGKSCDSTEVTSAEACTLVLEFGLLSVLSGDPKYKETADRALAAIWSRRSQLGMIGTTIDVLTGSWSNWLSSIGAGLDSSFEYLIKAYVLFGNSVYKDMFDSAYKAVIKHQRSRSGQYVQVHALTGSVTSNGEENLMMFWPALQVLHGDVRNALHSYLHSASVIKTIGLPPESFVVQTQRILLRDSGYVLRPEFVESTLALYQATKDPVFLEIGETFLDSLESTCRIGCGYAAVGDLLSLKLQDRLDTFFFSETLKYLYLLFDENNFVLQTPHLFTTQAHVIPLTAKSLQQYRASANYTSRGTCPSSLKPNWVRMFMCTTTADHLAGIRALQSAHLPPSSEPETVSSLRVSSPKYGTTTFPVQQATYGPRIPVSGIHAPVSTTSPDCACRPLLQFQRGNIALATRGNCTFAEKTINAQTAGAIAIVISDNVVQPLFPMIKDQSELREIHIPSVLITKESMRRLHWWITAENNSLRAALLPTEDIQ